MTTYRDLKIWQKAIELVTDIYDITKSFPKDEVFGLTSQLRRSAISVPSNISEGYGRFSNNEFRRFLLISRGSLFECQTQIEIARRLTYLSEEKFKFIYNNSQELDAMLTAFTKKLQKNIS
ncbi:MAG: four helix bundle protein [Flavobacterium sp.]|uniref:four helix bundle protein n=1 Tax=Flavobacterium sp. TaxID=239 RepID=UPI00120C7D03|nr:four helix bundle protein [Flavobacterium sp.]RZJ65784.1 MAG: four helix bundle protein [Flavobacterium sp.]